MLNNIYPIEDLRSLARVKSRGYVTKTINPSLLEEHRGKGWEVIKQTKKSIRLRKEKSHDALLEDRVWMLLYKMQFKYLSGDGGGYLMINPRDIESPKNQIDIVGIDDEVAVAIECKSQETYGKRPQFQEELGKHALIRDSFAKSINTQYPAEFKRKAVLAMFLSNVSLSDADRKRAEQANVMLFDERDLSYYEELTSHIGPAAKYQFLADMLPGKTIPGLEIRVPAVRTKMGGLRCYTFLISPQYLLKVGYVSHRAKGKASDINTYQRMLRKSRLKDIREYIGQDGIFPTNIVVNFEANKLQFERTHQEKEASLDQDVVGWLTIRPAYKSAWVIDGQHRLFAYSGHEKAEKSRLAVLAFEGLHPSKQAQLFIDINSKQKSVKRSLLQELYSELKWDAEKPQERVGAIIAKAILVLDEDRESPFYGRIQRHEETKDEKRCITLTSLYSAIEKTEFYIAKERGGEIVQYGPLWVVNDSEATLKRTVHILKSWFNVIATKASDWWEKGSGEGGGLAMNDGVTVCINVLRSVFQHVDPGYQKLIDLDNEDLFECVRQYAEALGDYLGSLSEEQRREFRQRRGSQGQIANTRQCQRAIRDRISQFNPPGLDEFLEAEKIQTNKKAKEIIDRIETTLQKLVVDELKQEFGGSESEWWVMGVPKAVRKKVTDRYEEDDGKRGGKEYYFDLIDYREIVLNQWNLFEKLLAYGQSGNKQRRTEWMVFVNDKRRIVSHASSGVPISVDDLHKLEEYDQWLVNQITGSHD